MIRLAISKTTALAMLAMFKTRQDSANANKFVQKVSGKDLSANDFTNAYKTKLDGIATGAEVNVIKQINIDGDKQTVTNGVAELELGAYATKEELKSYAKSADLTTVFVYKGTVASYADLPADSDCKVGYVYNITNAGGTDSKGVAIKAGDNVVYCESTQHVGGWDVLGGTTDLSNYVTNDGLTQTLGGYITTQGLASTCYTKTETDNAFLTKTNASSTYVAKVSGKGLSTNDFTNELLQKLNDLYTASDEQITDNDIAALFA